MREEIKNWWEQAQADLKTAENSLNSGDYYASVFWCQQAIEKSLKAYIIFSQRKSPGNIHSLIKLGKMANIPKEYNPFLRNTSPEYYITRYPDASEDIPYKLYNKEETIIILKQSKDVIGWLNKQIKR